jgi:sirohydrochlorin ferrochelatase
MTEPSYTAPDLGPPRDVRLLLVGHGSKDPRHALSLRLLADTIQAAGVRHVAIGFLDHCEPSVGAALGALLSQDPDTGSQRDGTRGRSGHGPVHVVALPLFLTTAYHVRHDVPTALRDATRALSAVDRQRLCLTVEGALGPEPLLRAALTERLGASASALRRPHEPHGDRPPHRAQQKHEGTGTLDREYQPEDSAARRHDLRGDARLGVVLGAAGTSDREALAGIAAEARAWRAELRCEVVPAYASTATPEAALAVRALLARGAERVAIASYFLAPGLLHDRLVASALAAGAEFIADPLCTPHDVAPALVRLILARFRQVHTPCRAIA